MTIHDDTDSSSDVSDTASERAYRAECKRLADNEAEYYARHDIVVEIEVLRNPNPSHVDWINAVNGQHFSNITDDTLVGALGFFVRALIFSYRLLAKDHELTETEEEWYAIMSGWLNDQARKMADILGRDEHEEQYDALRDPQSVIVSRVREWMSDYEFQEDADLRIFPPSEAEKRHGKRSTPMFAQPSLIHATNQRLQKRGIALLPKNSSATLSSASPATSPITSGFSDDSRMTARTRLHSDATSAGKSSLSDESLRTPAGGGVKVVSLPSTPEDPKEGKEDNTSEKDQAQDGRVQIIPEGDQ